MGLPPHIEVFSNSSGIYIARFKHGKLWCYSSDSTSEQEARTKCLNFWRDHTANKGKVPEFEAGRY